MAIRQKTIEYSFDTRLTTLASNTRFDFSSRTLTIEETNNRVFKSVFFETTHRSQATGAATYSAWTLGIKLGAVAFSDTTVTTTMASTSEHHGLKFVSDDLSSYFNTNFGSGTTQTCQVGVSFNGNSTINLTAKLIITYEFDDAGQTLRTKTVRIPLESPLVQLTNTLTEIGTNQVPTLSGGADPFLPESGVQVKDLWFEFEANEAHTAGQVDFNLALSLDAEAEVQDGSHEQNLISSPWYKYIWRRTDMSQTATHQFKARTTTTGRMSLATVTLYVTYTYNHTNSTRVLNSIIVPFHLKTPNTTALYHTFAEKFSIAEPGTISLKQSGVRFNMELAGTATVQLKFGEQSSTSSYVFTSGATTAGQYTAQARLDSSSRHGAGISLSTGHNNYVKGRVVPPADSHVFCVSGYGIINYHSDIFSQGADTHNHTTYWLEAATGLSSSNPFGPSAPTTVPTISGTKYWISAIGHQLGYNGIPSTGVVYSNPVFLEISRNVGVSGSHVTAYQDFSYPSASAIEYSEHWSNSTDFWDRRPDYPAPPTTTSGFIGSTGYRFWYTQFNSTKHLQSVVTYHTMPYVVSGTVGGYLGDGSGIMVHIRDPDDYVTASGITTASGFYNISVYDNRPGYVADARQDGSRVGRSDNITPTQP